MFRKSYGEVFAGDEHWNGLDVPTGDRFAWDARSTYVRLPPYFEGMPPEPAPVEDRGRARAGRAGRLRHHRPHLPRGRDQARRARRALPAGAGRRPARLQLLRLAPRQPRGDDARHLRQHPHPQPDGRPAGALPEGGLTDYLPAPTASGECGPLRGRRRRRGAARSCRSTTPRCATCRRRAARRARRQGVRLRLLTRLGREGHQAARRARRDRAELRAHPPLQPRRHGRAAAAVPRRPERARRWGSPARRSSRSTASPLR